MIDLRRHYSFALFLFCTFENSSLIAISLSLRPNPDPVSFPEGRACFGRWFCLISLHWRFFRSTDSSSELKCKHKHIIHIRWRSAHFCRDGVSSVSEDRSETCSLFLECNNNAVKPGCVASAVCLWRRELTVFLSFKWGNWMKQRKAAGSGRWSHERELKKVGM